MVSPRGLFLGPLLFNVFINAIEGFHAACVTLYTPSSTVATTASITNRGFFLNDSA